MKTSLDTFYEGRLVVEQPSDGYRSSVDSILLSSFVCGGRGAAACLDLGAGSGTIGLSLLVAGHVSHVTAVEVQSDLAFLASRNATVNKLQNRFSLFCKDIRQLSREDSSRGFDIVVMNPPFWPLTHRLPTDSQRRVACHEVLGTIDDWTFKASEMLSKRKGRVSMVYPAKRLDELILSLSATKLHCSRLRLVYPNAVRDAELALVEARPVAKGNLSILPPLFLKTLDGQDTDEVQRIVSGAFSQSLSALPDRRSMLKL